MAIVNLKKTVDHISNWIKNYVDNAGIQTLVLGLSGGVDSALVALLCKKTGKPVVCVNMPCHSSSNAFLRAENFAKEFGLYLVKIDLSPAHNAIYGQALTQGIDNALGIKLDMKSNLAVGGLRSCLRAPTLSYFANATKGLIVGTGNRSEDNITRYFQKYGDGCVDISPISDLFKGEVYELFAYLSSQSDRLSPRRKIEVNGQSYMLPTAAFEIFQASPTADLWGPDAGQEDEKELGISYDEIEWADREDTRTRNISREYVKTSNISTLITTIIYEERKGIIFSNEDPAKHPAFQGYTGRQQQVVAKLHQLEKISRHKINTNLPCCKVRDIEGLVK